MYVHVCSCVFMCVCVCVCVCDCVVRLCCIEYFSVALCV